MRKWYEKWQIWLGILGVMVIISVFIPQIIDWIYPKKGILFTVTTFTKEQLLSFYGSVLGFIGTLALGTLALWQNINMSKMVKEQEILKYRAFFALVSVNNFEKYIIKTIDAGENGEKTYVINGEIFDFDELSWLNSRGLYFGLTFEQVLSSIVIKNVGGNFAHHVVLSFEIDGIKYHWDKIDAIAVGEEIIFYPSYRDITQLENKTLKLIIEFKDMFNNCYEQEIQTKIIENRLAFSTNSQPQMIKKRDNTA